MRTQALFFAASLLCTSAVAAEPAFKVIVHESNAVKSLPRSELANLFLKKTTQWKDGAQVRPVDLVQGQAARASFSERVLQRPVSAVLSYWQTRVFSGRDVPPPEKGSDADVVAFVRANPGAIGYVSAGADTSGTRVLTLQD